MIAQNEVHCTGKYLQRLKSRNMKFFNVRCPALLPCFLTFVFFSCKAPEPFEFRGLENLTLGEVNTDSATITTNVVFYNPNSFRVSLKNLESDFYANESLISHYVLDTLLDVPAATEMRIPVSLRVNVQPILSNAVSAFLNRQILLRMKGKTQLGHSGIFITVPFEFSKNQQIDLPNLFAE